jgi:hypothetical protein
MAPYSTYIPAPAYTLLSATFRGPIHFIFNLN